MDAEAVTRQSELAEAGDATRTALARAVDRLASTRLPVHVSAPAERRNLR